MKTLRKMFPIVTAAIAICALSGTTANAAFFVGGYTASVGNTAPQVDAAVSVAVYQASAAGTLAGDTFGLGLGVGTDAIISASSFGAAALSSNWLYLYQMVNTEFPPGDLAELFSAVQITGIADINQTGALNGFVFNDAAGAVGYGGNIVLGTDPGAPDLEPSPVHFAAGVIAGSTVTTQGAPPASTVVSSNLGAGQLLALFTPTVSAGLTSSLFGYTSDFGPTFGSIFMLDAGNTSGATFVSSDGQGPIIPVPSTAMLFGSLFPVLAGAVYRKRNRQVAA